MADLGILKGGQAVAGASSPRGNFEIYDVFQANLPRFMSASNHQESYECECDFFKKFLFIYKTKVPTQDDTSAAAVAIAYSNNY